MPDSLIDEAMEALGLLRESALWSELADSDAVYAEVPIAVTGEGGDGAVVRGVIDLVYRVADGGWKIVDYKSDGVNADPGSIEEIRSRYSAQVESYARYWERISGDRVTAKGLWSTQQGYVSV
jgi:ATP-dependent exoDNAse (exonuclease V) beta subunit